mmetsp:Transcript_9163/g.19843  ORF Transcript_9163/g.19843 Transcript_9163/m.19843 type:complete len:436 (+) Transcript_9163:90-1397(+)
MHISSILSIAAFWLSCLSLLALATGEYVGGTAHDTPVDLDDDSFQAAIEDSANPFWLLKFYAPWCGHCKKMAPVLDTAAAKLKGKMAIGKIDCTQHKAVCNNHKVKGFPTLKYSIDGKVMDYSGGRDELDILSFAHKMSEPAVIQIRRLEEAKKFAHQSAGEGIVFLGSGKKDAKLRNVFKNVARKMQANAYFLWLEQLESPTDDERDNSYVDRIEVGITEPGRWETTEADLTEENFAAWVKDQNIPTISTLTPKNFQRISRNGRPLLMAIVDMENEDLVNAIKSHIMEFILRAPKAYVEKRYYGLFDGKKWHKFLQQFEVKQEDNPQFMIFAPLDLPGEKTYWRNETYTKLNDFLKAVEEGEVPPRHPAKKKVSDDPFGWMTDKFMQFFPFSMIPIAVLTVLIVWAMTPSMEGYDEEYDISEDESIEDETKKDN